MNSLPSLSPIRFGHLIIKTDTFNCLDKPNEVFPNTQSEISYKGFTNGKVSHQFRDDLDYLEKNFNVDIEIAVKPRGDSPDHRYEVTFIEKDPKDYEKDHRVHAFWTYVSSDPLTVLTSAITTAHRYYGKRVIDQRDQALKKIEALRTGIEGIEEQARKILDPKGRRND